MTRFDLYAHAGRQSRRAGAWAAVRAFVWLMLCASMAFWAIVYSTTFVWRPH